MASNQQAQLYRRDPIVEEVDSSDSSQSSHSSPTERTDLEGPDIMCQEDNSATQPTDVREDNSSEENSATGGSWIADMAKSLETAVQSEEGNPFLGREVNSGDNGGIGPINGQEKQETPLVSLASPSIFPIVEHHPGQSIPSDTAAANTKESAGRHSDSDCSRDSVSIDNNEKKSFEEMAEMKKDDNAEHNEKKEFNLEEIDAVIPQRGNMTDSDDSVSQDNHPAIPSLVSGKSPSNETYNVMNDYWEEVAKSKNAGSITSENQYKRRATEFENTDMKPCVADPELDGELEDFGVIGISFLNETKKGICRTDSVDGDDGQGISLKRDPQPPQLAEVRNENESNSLPCTEASSQVQIKAQRNDGISDNTLATALSDMASSHLSHEIVTQANNLAPSLEIPSNAAPLPDPTAVHESGSIYTRSSFRTILTKNWRRTHWVRYGNASLFVFRSKDDFEDWLLNPYHTQSQRDYLVKLRMDFLDEMTKRNKIRGYKMTKIKPKLYGKHTPPMYQFKLERWADLGVSLVAAFASPAEGEVRAIRKGIDLCLSHCPNNGLRSIDDLVV